MAKWLSQPWGVKLQVLEEKDVEMSKMGKKYEAENT